jgi:sugar phosphate isomerase/epimerase
MKLLLSTGAFPGFSIENSMSLARDVGADGIELMLTPRMSRIDPDYLRGLEVRFDMPIRSVHTTMRLRRAPAEILARDIVQSAQFAGHFLECDVLVVHPPQVQSLHDPAAHFWFDAITSAVEVSSGAQFAIAIENSGRTTAKTPTWAFDHPHRLLWLTEEWDLRITYDTSHAASRNWELLDTLRTLLPRVVNIHLSDVNATRNSRFGLINAMTRDHQLPGSGSLPLDELITRLAQAQYDGTVTLELSPFAVRAWWRPTAVRRISEALERCRDRANQVTTPQQRPQERL